MFEFTISSPFTFFIASLFIVFLIIASFITYGWYSRFSLSKKMTNRVHRAAEGEKNAKRYLLDHGFTILGEQVHISRKLTVDNTAIPFTLRADFLVRKGMCKAVVDAKSGLIAADPKNPETRRRLFEYYYYYGVKKAYIYDDVKKTLKKIDFLDVTVHRGRWRWFLAGIFCGSMLFVLFIFIANKV